MKTINKKEIVERLHKRVGLSKRLIKSLVDELLEEIKRALDLGEEVKIVRFGSFVPYKTKERKGRNLKTKEEVKIKPFKKVVFYTAPQFRAELHNENQK